MQEGTSPDGTVTDQWRFYSEDIAVLSSNDKPLRLVLQASAGTGKSFLPETLFLWCHLNGHMVRQQHQLASLPLVCACPARQCTLVPFTG